MELAWRPGVTKAVVRRLLDPDHAPRIEGLHAALDVGLVMEDAA